MGLCPDVHGHESLTQIDLITSWLAAKRLKKIMVPVPRPGKLKQLGKIQPVAEIAGGRNWAQWLKEEGGSPSPYTCSR